MLFRISFVVRDLFLKPADNGSLEFDIGGTHGVTVSFRYPTDDQQAAGYEAANTLGTVLGEWEVSDKVRSMFEDLLANKLPPGSQHPDLWPRFDIDPAGNITPNVLPHLTLMPEPFQFRTQQIHDELWGVAKRVALVLRWRVAQPGPHNPFSVRNMEWSFDGDAWHSMPWSGSVQVDGNVSWRPSAESQAEVRQLVVDGWNEPLGHTLLREAWQQRGENPRSSLIVGIAAAETGLKELLGQLVPGARWLVENVPSPPLVRMLKEYLPDLPAKQTLDGKVLPPPDRVLETLTKGVTLRNQVAHGSAGTLRWDTVEEVLEAVRDVLWLLDHYNGLAWALEFVRPETRAQLGVEA